MEESRESTIRITEHDQEHEQHRPKPALPPTRRRGKPKYRGGAGPDHCNEAETKEPLKFKEEDPVIYRPSKGEAVELEIADVIPTGKDVIYRLRYRKKGPIYADNDRGPEDAELFEGSELEDDSPEA